MNDTGLRAKDERCILMRVARVILALLFGCLISGLTLEAGRQDLDRMDSNPQIRTGFRMKEAARGIAWYQQTTGHLPRTLSELPTAGDPNEGRDGWGRMLHYIVRGNHYELISYGQDGLPGGEGWDHDLRSDDPHPRGSELTIPQFVREPEATEAVAAALLSGIAAGVLCFLMIRPRSFSAASAAALVIKLVVVLVASAFVGAIMTMAELPAGH